MMSIKFVRSPRFAQFIHVICLLVFSYTASGQTFFDRREVVSLELDSGESHEYYLDTLIRFQQQHLKGYQGHLFVESHRSIRHYAHISDTTIQNFFVSHDETKTILYSVPERSERHERIEAISGNASSDTSMRYTDGRLIIEVKKLEEKDTIIVFVNDLESFKSTHYVATVDSLMAVSDDEVIYVFTVQYSDPKTNPHWRTVQYWFSNQRALIKEVETTHNYQETTELFRIYAFQKAGMPLKYKQIYSDTLYRGKMKRIPCDICGK